MVPKSSLQLVALCCVQVAAKCEETEELVPSLSKLRYFGSNIYSVDIIRKMELAVCVELKWSMGVVRPSHFIEAIVALTRKPDDGNIERVQISDKLEDVSSQCTMRSFQTRKFLLSDRLDSLWHAFVLRDCI